MQKWIDLIKGNKKKSIAGAIIAALIVYQIAAYAGADITPADSWNAVCGFFGVCL